MTHDEMVKELARRYGGNNIYSKYFDHPLAQIYFHKTTGFSIGMYRLDTKAAFLYDEGELQATYRIDK